MKQFKGLKTIEQIEQDAKNSGWQVDLTDYNNGGDWFWLRDMENRALQVLVNGFNGWFIVYAPISDKPIATHLSKELDNQKWYLEILELIYNPV